MHVLSVIVVMFLLLLSQYGGYMGPMGQSVDCPPEFVHKDVIELKFGVLYPPPPGKL